MEFPIVTLIILASLLEVHSRSQCVHDQLDQCTCIYGKDYEFHCPMTNFEDFNVLIHAVPNEDVKMQCLDFKKYNLDILPNYKAGNNVSMEFRFCPLPDDNFLPTLSKFGIKVLTGLTLENVSAPANATISKKILHGLNLTDLHLTYIYNKIEDDLLSDCSSLMKLQIDHSYVDDISKFEFPPHLQVLHLTANLISEIPVGIFRNLTKLFQLHLWSNQIKYVRKGAFDGLENLTSLELSSNSIEDIEKHSFDNLIKLQTISLSSNKLKSIDADIFKYNKNLISIRLEKNPIVLPDYIFSNFEKLALVRLERSGLVSLPEHIFHNSGIKVLMLQMNRIENLPENVFQGLGELGKLDLSQNRLSSLPNDIFSSLTSVKEINLGYNNISEINENLFAKTTSLEILLLNNNRISVVDPRSFTSLAELKSIDMSDNLYRGMEGSVPFSQNTKLEKMILRNNLIEEFGDNYSLTDLREVDLSFNRMEKFSVASILMTSPVLKIFKLNNNKIGTIDFDGAELTARANQNNEMAKTQVDLHGNPITCDCMIYDLIVYSQEKTFPSLKKRIDLQIDGMRCASPEMYRNVLISTLKPEEVICIQKIEGCPKQCKSFWRPSRNFAVLDCSHRNLTGFPKINVTKHENIEVNLTGNDITGGLDSTLGYQNVKNLFLSNNKLQELKWIPLGIERLSLDHNELTHLDPELLKMMNKTTQWESLKLSHNPWSCGCSALTFQLFIRDNYKKINTAEVICKEDNKPLVGKKELCKSSSAMILMIVLPVLSFLILTVVALVFYIYFRQEMKVWLFSKNLCLWFVSEDELDEDKMYDIFLSYSNQDEDFVMQNLLPVLESGPKPFKICIHIRDWEPGEEIMTHVMNSVLQSRRTLVVLSNNFLESVWGKLEFKTAHMRGIEEGRARVIVVKYGELDETKLDDALKAYLSTNTYVEWGQPWFWNKLKYALPHSRQRAYRETNQKHANVMLTIDDRFELTAPPLKAVESTPPVMTVNSSLHENHHSDITENPFVISA